MSGRGNKRRKKADGNSAKSRSVDRSSDAPESADDSAADSYVAELAEGGRSEGPGQFTLDREVARKKLRDFQLPDPDLYIVLFVQAAVRQGAERIDILTSGKNLRLQYTAPRLERRDLEQLYDAALGGGGGASKDRTDLRRALGLGISVARNRVRRLALTSRDGADGVRLIIQPGRPDAFETFRESAAGEPTLTSIELEYPLTWNPAEHEIAVLRHRCRYAAQDILIDGKPISHGLNLPKAAAKVRLRDDTTRGEAGFEPLRTSGAELRIVQDGVLIAEHALSMDDVWFTAVVQDPRLSTDLSGFDVVRDAAYADLIRAVKRARKQAKKEHNVKQVCGQWARVEAASRVALLNRLRRRLQRRYYATVFGILPMVAAGLVCAIVLQTESENPWQNVPLEAAIIVPFLVLAALAIKPWLVLTPLAKRAASLLPEETPLWEAACKIAPWLSTELSSKIDDAREHQQPDE